MTFNEPVDDRLLMDSVDVLLSTGIRTIETWFCGS